ncbi:MAG TPA: hypothetical protein VFP71_03090 [Candidatus Angelobacter sp.]|nr:hypothetical protein [Candidatus Angelobacter sp.]
MISDFDKTAELILSDSAFDTLSFVESKIAEMQAQLAELKEQRRQLAWDSFESQYNWEAQREVHGQLLAFAKVQGHLQGITMFKRAIADSKRATEVPQEVA